ncbi:hypothetical protein NECAME_08991 [Necator americanus]|uniref:Uncharacterized protein n=1 Tax=Necator americanus TaxID=51031 RepID=W2TGI2_NECAM|nr:hypothetical protein NECAME_08991 [Necator americanus]ETN80709.1 hypothetical protein NECAME_08991 [Necator americanus]
MYFVRSEFYIFYYGSDMTDRMFGVPEQSFKEFRLSLKRSKGPTIINSRFPPLFSFVEKPRSIDKYYEFVEG